MIKQNNAKLILETGEIFFGIYFGVKPSNVFGELVFNTSMTGYQEILTDPSYNQQIVVMTFPLQGVYGISQNVSQSSKIQVAGFVINELIQSYLNNSATKSLDTFLKENNTTGIYNISVRDLTKIIREKGNISACICDINTDSKKIIESLQMNKYTSHVKKLKRDQFQIYNSVGKKSIILYDLGAKNQMLTNFIELDYRVIVVPYNTKYQDIKKYDYEGLFFSNGPGDPSELTFLIGEIKKMIKNNEKILGICLGHQLISLALGYRIIKLKFGHHSSNHPVEDVINNKIIITSQNHNYATDINSISDKDVIAFRSLNDNTVEGIKVKNNIFSIQFHPEAAPGPYDASYIFELFDNFLKGSEK